jgi:hypothetical protein
MIIVPSADALGYVGDVSVTVSAESHLIQETRWGDEVSIKGFGRMLIPGKPDLPAMIHSIAIPPGAELTSITFEAVKKVILPGRYRIPPAPLPGVIGEEDPVLYERDRKRFEANYKEIYESDEPFPSGPGEFVRRAGYRKYNLVDVRITPFSYKPLSGVLVYRPEITIHIGYTLPDPLPRGSNPHDNMVRTEEIARDIILNYDQAQDWYGNKDPAGQNGLHDFVIITLDSLTEAVIPLVEWEKAKGRTVKVVTRDWIAASYTGYDLAEKIRNFLRDKYPSSAWGIQDVLIAGHWNEIPLRLCEQDTGFGKPRTDYYYAELSLPDSQSWDMDGDHLWGENSDPLDFYAEVNVGRLPWSDAETVEHICNKCVAFENHYDPAFKKNILLLGAFTWPNTDNAVLMEYKTEQGLHPWMADWTSTRLYEQHIVNYSQYPCDYALTHANLVDVWANGKFAVVNLSSHGMPTYVYTTAQGTIIEAILSDYDCPELDDDYPAIMFADACSTSETDTKTCLGREMMKQGTVGYLGATKPSYGVGGWSHPSHGSGNSFDYYFTTRITSGIDTLGGSHQWALRKMYTHGLWLDNRFETFEWSTLFGNPCLGLCTDPVLKMSFPEGLPAGMNHLGLETELTLKIENGLEQFVSGTGYVHYRFDPGEPYITLPLEPAGDDLYEVCLPYTSPGDEPEFYFSAHGGGGTIFTSPYYAPEKVYAFDVALHEPVLVDDFESDRGWSVFNYLMQDGEWERGDPEETHILSDPVQPEEDHSILGTQCFVTGKSGGAPDDDDVDGFKTTLISPEFDLSGTDGMVSFYYWFYHSDTGKPFPMRIMVNDGLHWDVDVLTATHSPQWNHFTFRVSDFVEPADSMVVKINVSDYPDDDIVEGLVDDFKVERFNNHPSLWSDAYLVPAATGGSVNFSIDATASNAFRKYILLGSVSGTVPGTPLPGGDTTLPLEWDVLTTLILNNINSPLFSNFLGILDKDGGGAAKLTIPPLPAGCAGIHIYFAFTLFDPCDFVSNPLYIRIE